MAALEGNVQGRSPTSKAPLGGATEWSVALREACGAVIGHLVEVEQGVPSPRNQGEGHGSGEAPGSAAVKDSSAYGVRNVQIVATGTGEALPGPVVCDKSPLEQHVL